MKNDLIELPIGAKNTLSRAASLPLERTKFDINRSTSSNLGATHIIATTIGIFFGLFSGVNHGFFEILQGNTSTNGLLINAIGEGQRFWPEGTEPAFTIIPNFMITGIMSIIVGLAIVIWSIWFLPTKHGRTVYLGLFILLFLMGGGIGQIFSSFRHGLLLRAWINP